MVALLLFFTVISILILSIVSNDNFGGDHLESFELQKNKGEIRNQGKDSVGHNDFNIYRDDVTFGKKGYNLVN